MSSRDEKLNELEKAVTEWAAKTRDLYKRQASLAKSVIKGRTGSERLASSALDKTEKIVLDELDELFISSDLWTNCLQKIYFVFKTPNFAFKTLN